jgi:hypothetical protein
VIRLVALEGQAASDARFAQFLTDSSFLPENSKKYRFNIFVKRSKLAKIS